MIHKGKNSGKPGYMHKVVIKILVKTMQHFMLHISRYIEVGFEDNRKNKVVAEDVKEGHFAVVAVKCEKPTRFVVELRCLTNPGFLRLLNKAGEEYGFKHDGAIEIPCEPDELHMILQEMKEK
ncbi:hypothetical protein R6Q57_010545 [Mikania cordata]